MKLPKEIIMYIYSFDSKYHLKYKECIKELNMKIKQHNIFAKQIILITYNNVALNYQQFFKNFSPIFYKFILIRLI